MTRIHLLNEYTNNYNYYVIAKTELSYLKNVVYLSGGNSPHQCLKYY